MLEINVYLLLKPKLFYQKITNFTSILSISKHTIYKFLTNLFTIIPSTSKLVADIISI